jgi:isochorismate pyruvate lyase
MAQSFGPEGEKMDLAEIRAAIDGVDEEIVALIARRQVLVRLAGAQKADEAAVRAPDRVEKVIENVRELAKQAGAEPDVVEAAYRAMIGAFIEMEVRQLKDDG